MALTSMEQAHLDCLRAGLRNDPNNSQAFKWSLEADLLERYAANPLRDPSKWPKTTHVFGGNPQRTEEFRDWLRIEQSFPPYNVTWFTWSGESSGLPVATMRHLFGFTSLQGWSWMDRQL